MNKKFLIRTFGCQMNKLDSNLIENAFCAAGLQPTSSPADADIVLINTCSVRGHAEERVFSLLGHLKHIKKSRPELVVAVFGCMAQRLKDELLKHQLVNIVCGPQQISHLLDLTLDAFDKSKKQILISENIRKKPITQDTQDLDDFERIYDGTERNLPNQAFVRVMHGCNNFCSYCIVPFVRGAELSRPPEKIIEQIKRLAGEGVKQITLLGQTVNSYQYEKTSFAELLYKIAEVGGIEWIKFVTCYPKNFDENIFKAMAALPKVCRYLHIPAQSGSDKILKAMNRHYTAAEYLEILGRAREIVPDISIAGDFIVGFCGEGEDDFQKTVWLLKEAQYKNCFIFKYSPRPGTMADEKLPDNVPVEVKRQRNIDLLAEQEKVSLEINQKFVGQTVRVFVEGTSKKSHLDGFETNHLPQLIGRTAGESIVVFDGEENLAGSLADVEIERASALTLFGRLKRGI